MGHFGCNLTSFSFPFAAYLEGVDLRSFAIVPIAVKGAGLICSLLMGTLGQPVEASPWSYAAIWFAFSVQMAMPPRAQNGCKMRAAACSAQFSGGPVKCAPGSCLPFCGLE